MAVADDITAGFVAAIDGLGLSGVTVRDRKQAATTGLDAPAATAGTCLITVSVEDDRDEFETADDDTGRAGWYTAAVSIARRNGGDGLTGASTVRGFRQAVRRRLTREPLTEVPAVDWVDVLPTPHFDTSLLDEGWDYSWLHLRVKTREART